MSEPSTLTYSWLERGRHDRRSFHMRSLFLSLYKRRRRNLRRTADRHKEHYVDLHEPKLLITGVAILVLSCMDAWFTLLLLQHGAEEINPLMRLLIEIDAGLFIKTKIAITAFCVVFIVAHKNFWLLKHKIRVHSLMSATLIMYIVVINYQIGLLITYV